MSDRLLSAVEPIYLHAIGGLGKTEVAKAFCSSDYAKRYDYIFWVGASSDGDIRKSIMAEGVFAFSRDTEETNIDREFRRFAAHVKSLPGEILLIIDNVNTREQVWSIEDDGAVSFLKWKVFVTSRAIMDDATFLERVVDLHVLEESYCEELFYQHYSPVSEKDRENNKKLLDLLFEDLQYHTMLIVLLAKVGKSVKHSISDLQLYLKDRGLAHEELQTKIPVSINSRHRKASIEEVLVALFDLAKLTQEEQYILQCFAVLPSRAIPEGALLEWILTDCLPKRELKNLFRDLYENGWLFLDDKNPNYNAFGCHGLVQEAVRESMNGKYELEAFVENVANFFTVSIFDEEHLELLKYSDCAESIIKHYDHLTASLFHLKLEYIKLLHQNDYYPKSVYKVSIWLKNNYSKIFPETNQLEWAANWVEVQLLHSEIYIYFTEEKGKYKRVLSMRQEIFDFAKKQLPESHITYVRIQRSLAMAKKSSGDIKGAVGGLEKLLRKLKEIGADSESASSDWRYVYMRTLSAFAIGYNRLASSEKDEHPRVHLERLLQVLDIRKEYLDVAICLFGERHSFLRRPYNDLELAYLYLYDCDPQPEYLRKAEVLFSKRYEIINASGRFAPGSLPFIKTLEGLAALLERKGDYEGALEITTAVCDSRVKTYGGQGFPGVMRSFRRIARLSFELYERTSDTAMLWAAKENIETTIEICEHIYAGDVAVIEYKESLALKKCIMSAINSLSMIAEV